MKRIAAPLLAVAAAALVTGCASTGGGTIPTANHDKSGKASFGYTCDSTKSKGSGTYKDGDVSMSFTGIDVSNYACDATGQNGGTTMHYKSTNPANPGPGDVDVYFVDNGEGSDGTGDYLSVNVTSGPFAGYSNSGTVSGNIQIKKTKSK